MQFHKFQNFDLRNFEVQFVIIYQNILLHFIINVMTSVYVLMTILSYM